MSAKHYKLAIAAFDSASTGFDWKAVAIAVSQESPAVFLRAFKKAGGEVQDESYTWPEWKREARDILLSGDMASKIQAIKHVRKNTGWGLKESKEFCELPEMCRNSD